MLNGDLTRGELVELFRESLRGLADVDMSRDQLADLTGEVVRDSTVSASRMSHWLDDQKSAFVGPLGVVVALARVGLPGLLEALAESAGFGLVRREAPGARECDLDAARAAMAAMGTESEVVREFLAALEDGRVTDAELERVNAAVRVDHAANELLVEIMKRLAKEGGR